MQDEKWKISKPPLPKSLKRFVSVGFSSYPLKTCRDLLDLSLLFIYLFIYLFYFLWCGYPCGLWPNKSNPPGLLNSHKCTLGVFVVVLNIRRGEQTHALRHVCYQNTLVGIISKNGELYIVVEMYSFIQLCDLSPNPILFVIYLRIKEWWAHSIMCFIHVKFEHQL